MDKSIRSAFVVTAVGCFVLVEARFAELAAVAAVAKIIASGGFLAVAYFGGALQSAYGRLILLGLSCSLVGDAFLIGESQHAFLAGLAAFLLAHLAYVGAFARQGVNLRWAGAALVPVAGIAAAVFSWLRPFTAPALEMPVLLYTIVISSMVIAAVGTRGKGASSLILIGAILFFLSDLSVASQSLVRAEFPHYLWGLPFYYAGQLCLALSVSQSRSH